MDIVVTAVLARTLTPFALLSRPSTPNRPIPCHPDRRNGPLRSIAAQSPIQDPRALRTGILPVGQNDME